VKYRPSDGVPETHCPPQIASSTAQSPDRIPAPCRTAKPAAGTLPSAARWGSSSHRERTPRTLFQSVGPMIAHRPPTARQWMLMTATVSDNPPTRPLHLGHLGKRLFPSRRTKTAGSRSPARTRQQPPSRIHNVPGRYPNCAASTGPTSGPGPAIRGKMIVRTPPLVGAAQIAPVLQSLRGVARSESKPAA